MSQWFSTNFANYSVEFSPFRNDLIAIGAAQYFGIVGNGKQSVFRRDGAVTGSSGNNNVVSEWLTQDGVYDCAWSEAHESVLGSACGDGTVKLFDINRPRGVNGGVKGGKGQGLGGGGGVGAASSNLPIASIREHSAEVYGIDWNANTRNLICTASWDSTSLVIDANRMGVLKRYNCGSTNPIPNPNQGPPGAAAAKMLPQQQQKNVLYASIWSPHRANVYATVGADGKLNLFDINQPLPSSSTQAHQYEVLSLDWIKYNDTQLVTGGVDKQIRLWDLRNLREPLKVLFGHQLAVRRLKAHPHNASLVGSASYDMSIKVWDIGMGQMVQSFDHHSEFVLGLDFSLFDTNAIASASWDRSCCVWNHERGRPSPNPIVQMKAGQTQVPNPMINPGVGGKGGAGGGPILSKQVASQVVE